ncbi:MAG: hypothetical protein ACI8PZ_005015 [Myxococcota bacterium]|jgi:hypothetical protein
MLIGLMFWCGIALAGPRKDAAQTGFEVVEQGASLDFDFRWRDKSGGPDKVAFSLPSAAMAADREEVTWLKRRDMNEAVVKAVREWGRTVKGVKISAEVKNGGIAIGASGAGARAALKQAGNVRDAAMDEWLAENDFTRMKSGDLSFDHASLAAKYAPQLAPVANALAEGTESDRAFVARALEFVQSIPYEARKKNGGDPGYRRPVSLLERDRGDCDSKAVLFLAVVRARLPSVPLAVVYVPGHALTGVGLPEGKDDRTFKVDGTEFIYAEPVGPALFKLGEPAKENRKAGKKGEVRVL